MTSDLARGPLAGVRVLDLTAMLAGPFTTMLLADLGADVIKIEPTEGDRTRALGPFRPGDPAEALGGYFQSVNRGKGSIVLDLKAADDAALFRELVGEADVVVENFSTGVMERLGLSYEVLAAINPRLVYAALRGFGDARSGASPYETWPAFDIVAQAMGGFAAITGPLGGPPLKSGPGIGDIFPGALLALGVVAAVRHAEHTGQGQFVDVAMYDAVLALCERVVYQHSYLGIDPEPMGNGHPLLAPFDIMQTSDGWLAVAAPSDKHWRILTEAMGVPELADDPRFVNNAARTVNVVATRQVLGDWLGRHATAEVVALLGGKVPIGPVNTASDIFKDEHARVREMLVDVEQPGSDRPVTIAGVPIKFSRTPSATPTRGPLLGEDDPAQILARWRGQSLAPAAQEANRDGNADDA
ncbi:CaiB/BaiF CoA transferase family protein [Microbacterium trichothecenolyticum]|uniref:Formyl-coenzyme A transferase n=1 Tax=Microbacterium trichothecenolyticum TaxID=69370 RepID=A0A0M2H7H1_MICTR|nr:CoA transferase [Microbacterium trichothecenolyticum]KJL42340.1 Formyl-coenzyme A transferase [Microbacterium trichothecenolyticum]